ncbi:hypothetical protein [Legionella cincinnatiensis]|uniref:Uncharacterized protein n=1 Tax=Legionella cincinnatiensis TaxID=28085 RepID=A0A378IJX9_9GAMM|nr:hypothetical protein [Legionella cincinnatiensis]KTC83488.1 hypothetical protein Lcin_2175 [Legionella cincinnatiensis]STX35577.1 Uncharacterised protein [Legionella cincinnatiensis]
MFQLKLFNNQHNENLMTAKPCFSAYKRAFDEAVKNYDPSQKNPYINIKITSDFPNKEDVMKWNSSLTQLYAQINTKLNEYMSDYNMSVKQSSSGWTHTFTHLLNVKGIETMQQLLADISLELNSQVDSSFCP